MGSKFVNNWDSNISVGILSTDTTINVPAADALKLPTLSAGDYLILTITFVGATPSQNSWEVVKVTSVNTTTGDLTCVRGFEGTTAKDYLANNAISMDITAGEINIVKTDTTQNISDITILQNTKVASVVSGTGIVVDNVDPLNPIISAPPVSATDILAKIKTVDGAGSGLDADLLDGLDSTYFAPNNSPSLTGTPTVPTAALGTNTAQIASTAFVLANAVSNPEPSGTNYTYNTDGTVNVITETLPSGSQVSTLSYTTEGKVNTIVVTLNGTTKTYTYSYNAEGKVSGITKS